MNYDKNIEINMTFKDQSKRDDATIFIFNWIIP